MNKVIIVESPSKSKTIGTYLGPGYTVLSSKGHICDLATKGKNGLGIDIENGFTPTYKISDDKQKLVEYLKKECAGHQVYLATDPDREGEAIAYHLARTLGLDFEDLNRVEFHEITKTAVKEALENPHKIDIKMVDSQETRRMIDRILGFSLSTLLRKKISSPSAGRVQSVALLLIVNLEKEIKAFIPVNYYEIEGEYKGNKIKLNTLNGVKIDSKNRIFNRSTLEELERKLGPFTVTNIEKKNVSKSSNPTYTTSTMQQDANIKLGFAPTRTMNTAQSLYEGKNIGSETVGLITYMRTDSTRLADSFVKDVLDYIEGIYGSNYVGKLKLKSQKGAQDAHEGIRPTSIKRTPESLKPYLTSDEYKLYKLIYNRTLASLMSNSVYESTRVDLANTDSTWTMNGSLLQFDGYLKVYKRDEDDKDNKLPKLNVGDSFDADKIEILDKVTEPKKRYTEAALIKDMEELGIGRPSTYAQTIFTLKDRNYVYLDNKFLVPTEQGMLTTDKLTEFFSGIVNVKYTANMETDLDKIAKGEKAKLEELQEFYGNFEPLLDYAKEHMDGKYPIATDLLCPKCGHPLVIRNGKYGEFISCSNYPSCNYIQKSDNSDDDTGVLCPECGKANIVKRIVKTGKNKGNIFYACGNYPKCKTTFSDEPLNEECPLCGSIMLKDSNGNPYCSQNCSQTPKSFIQCPVCGKGNIVERTATRGKNKGNKFYACDNFPKCKCILNGEPTKELCPKCGKFMVKDANGNLSCSVSCDKKEEVKEVVTSDIVCPKCNKGHIVERLATRGANKGNKFYACDNYPRCKNIITIEEYNSLINKK